MTQSESVINWQIINSLADDQESRTAIINSFIESFESDLVQFLKAKASNDQEQLLTVAHTIKGAASNFCKPFVVEQIQLIESKYKEGSFDNIDQDAEVIKEVVNRIIDEFKSKL